MEEIKQRAQALIVKLDVENKKEKIDKITQESSDPSFWKDPQAASTKMKELALLILQNLFVRQVKAVNS